MATENTNITTETTADFIRNNMKQWEKLKPGFNRIFVSQSTIDALKKLKARGKLRAELPPTVHMAALLNCIAVRREVDTRCSDAGSLAPSALPPSTLNTQPSTNAEAA